uniref:Uncharacterized protein n=1 Tax=Strongyloides papillosus TaxID=174720 RepID=A0A0N5B4S2_STREA
MTISLYKPLLKMEYLIDSLSIAGFFGNNKKVVFFYFNIQLFYIMLIFCDGYKFSCENRYFCRRCALLLSITEPYYKSLFLNNLPKQLRDIVGRYAETEKLYTVGLLKNTNKLLEKEITQYFMVRIISKINKIVIFLEFFS